MAYDGDTNLNNSKNETKSQHFISMNKRRWVLGSETVESRNFTHIKILEFSKTMLVRFLPVFLITLKKTQKKWECYFRPILTEEK